MGITRRLITAAALGALAGAGWLWTTNRGIEAICTGDGLECLGVETLAYPATMIVWMLLVGGLLRLTGFRPAWPAAITGPIVLIGFIILAMAWDVQFRGDALVLAAGIAAFGYTLAALLTAGYGGRRDRQDPSLRG